jgi:hypothetical protein
MLNLRRDQSAQLAHSLDNGAARCYLRACLPFAYDERRQQELRAPSTNLEKARLGHAARVVHAASRMASLTKGESIAT